MLKVNVNSIAFTRGDTAYLNIAIYKPSGDIYQMQQGDEIHFCIREFPKTQNCPPLIQKTFEDYTIKILPEDTKYLKYGRYFWDATLIFANGDINTICSGDITLTYEIE